MSYSVQNIRNVCLLGHGGNGKTSLAESMLYLTGGTVRLGNPADGNTVCDYDPEETRRQISISTAVAPVEYNGCKINVLDTPGYFDWREDRGPPGGRRGHHRLLRQGGHERGRGEGVEAVRAAQAAPAALHLQDRRGELRLQRRLRHPAGALRQEYRPRGRPHLGRGQEGHWLYRRAPQARL